jgi:YidC/Oxa1 family membrane protein insertase
MDIKRTVLWVVFLVSLLLCGTTGNRYTGKPSMFFDPGHPAAKAPATHHWRAAAANTCRTAGRPQPRGRRRSAGRSAGRVPPHPPRFKSERITITTDVIKADIDTIGGVIKPPGTAEAQGQAGPTKNVVLFDSSNQAHLPWPDRPDRRRFPEPPHAVHRATRPRTLDDGNEVKLVLTSEQGGVKLTKTYTFKRGDYVIDVKHDVSNLSGAPVSPSLYVQLLRDGGASRGDSKFYSTFTGPAVHRRPTSSRSWPSTRSASGKADHATKSDNGWIAMVAALFRLGLRAAGKGAKREIFTKKVDNNLYAVGNILPLGAIAPGATVSMDSKLYSGPQESEILEKVAPGLELVKDYGWLTIIAKPIFWLMTTSTTCWATGAGPSSC